MASPQLSPDRAALLLLVAARNAGVRFETLEFDEDKHPRDERGRFSTNASEAITEKHGTTLHPESASFLLRDGKLVRGNSMHHQALAEKAGTTLDALEKEGVVRLVSGGAETPGVPSSQQASLIADHWNTDRNNDRHFLDVNVGGVTLGSVTFESRKVTAAAIINFAKRAVNHPKDQPPIHEIRRLADGQREETAVHAAADAHKDKIKVAIRFAFAMGRKHLPNADAAATAVKQALLETLPNALLATLVAGGRAGLSLLPARRAAAHVVAPHVTLKFDAANPDAAAWAKAHAAELAQGLSDTTRDAIKAAVANQELTGEDATDVIAAAVGDDARAELIARTESMSAANEGQRQGWDQAVEDGLLRADSKRVWIAAEDPCPECEDLDGEETGLDEDYPNDGGDGPLLHPNCRCTEGIAS